jgi:hypothetical protein
VINVQTTEGLTKAAAAASAKKALLKEVGAKWRKFSETELSRFSTKDEVVTQVAALYRLDKARALVEVDALFKGRHL